MSGDLEDFLRRAAQRRQAKAAQANQPAAAPRKRPQYSNSRTERVARTVETDRATDEVLVAEVVDHNSINKHDRRKTSTEQQQQQQQAKAVEKQAGTAAANSATDRSSSKRDAASAALNSQAGIELLNALRSPGGVRQAILLREILDRPTHRW